MSKANVFVAVACAPSQIPAWWGTIMVNLLGEERSGNINITTVMAVSSALPDHNKNNTVSMEGIAPATEKRRNTLTDANRSKAVGGFLESNADWLFFIDDDTVFPPGTINQLVALRREIIGGVYYNANHPYNPIAYLRGDNGLYQPVSDYSFGAIFQVDSIGMGCTLIHRSVFEKIMDAHTLFHRPNGSLLPVLKKNIYSGPDRDLPGQRIDASTIVYNGYLVQRLSVPEAPDNRSWPFYALEFGRTEDHHFCELAANVGIRPWLDTSINCEHWKQKATTRKDYLAERKNENESSFVR